MTLFEVSFVVGLLVYLIPAFIARSRGKHNAVAIAMLNIFLGWTVIGWGIALVWAVMNDDPQVTQP